MQEKVMVADTLAGINGELTRYAGMIAQTENFELKQKLKQLRNSCEQSQEELYQIARAKSYYVPAQKASDDEVAHVRSLFTQGPLSKQIIYCIKRTGVSNDIPVLLIYVYLVCLWFTCQVTTKLFENLFIYRA